MERDREKIWHEFGDLQANDLKTWTKQVEEHLLAAAREEGGSLSIEQIHLVLRGWRQEHRTYEDKIVDILRSYESWVQERPWVEERQNLTARLIVGSFETLLSGHHPDGLRGGALSRKFVPPFLKAVRMLVGSEIFTEVQAELESVFKSVQRHGRDLKDPRVWTSLYGSHAGLSASRRISGRFLARFDVMDKRVDWLVNYVNDNFPSWDMQGLDADWKCTDRHIHRLLQEMSEGLSGMMKDARGVAELKRLLGDDDYKSLRKVLTKLAKQKA